MPTVLDSCNKHLDSHSWAILVGGGDGSVSWILSELDKVKNLNYRPPVVILPLGTGNDLSRALGWGPGYSGERLCKILENICTAGTVNLDRWNIERCLMPEVKGQVGAGKVGEKKEELEMPHNFPVSVINNYLSIGGVIYFRSTENSLL